MKSANSLVIRVCVIAALAGLLFGLDVAYVNGALDLISKEFHLNVADSGYVAGYLLFGAAAGAFVSGWLSRKFGRRNVLIIAALIFTLVTFLGTLAHSFEIFLIARFILGVAIGIASFVAPLYPSEVAPYHLRGGLIALYQFMITLGIFLMFVSNTLLLHFGSWRLMMLVLIIPSLIMLIGTFTLPESPRFKVLVGKEDEALEILNKIRLTKDEANFEFNEIKTAVANHRGGFSMLKNGYFIKVIILGICLQALQQFVGMNAFMYYSGNIFKDAGFANPNTATLVVGLVNMLTTILAIRFVDKLGRKPILYFGLILLFLSCVVVGYIFEVQSSGVALTDFMQHVLLISCLVFIFAFAISLGPIIWILCPEIFPLEGRDLGVTVTTMTNWVCNSVIGIYTLVWFNKIGVGHTFWMFGLVCFLGILLVKFFVPETKDVPLEEIEFNLKSGVPLAKMGKRTTI